MAGIIMPDGMRPENRAPMKTRNTGDQDLLPDPSGSMQTRLLRWLARVTVFALIFAFLAIALVAVGRFLERFFVVLYTS